MNYQRKIIIALAMLIGLLLTGTIGYLMLERDSGWYLLDAVYMTVITLTTAGHDDLEMSDNGRIFTILLLVGGLGVFTYCVTVATAFLIEGQLQSFFRQQKMIRTVDKLSNHYIICGLGDTGVHVLDEMLKAAVDFVGIEAEEERLIHLTDTRNFSYLHGDATDDELLIRAGIERARGLVTCLSRDQDNLFVVISARKLNPHLRIASKAVEDNSPGKLITAGADEVVLPDHIGGLRLASGILQPHLVGFLENITQNQDGAQFTESVIQKDCPVDGISLKAASIREQTGLVVIAIRDNDGTFLYNPPGDKKMVAGDALLVIANQKQLQTLHKLTGDLN
ncbi:potassium channel protein [Candidatus Poribacteria bacterium]|nr:potassium channel protein [Candidatus Poribacteria bacterium]MYB01138.1 potassium channel protein [Candidatus Poribacteria bacterium]